MSEVDLTIGGRKFKIICADGEEPSLRNAADVLDGEAQFITSQVGQVSDSRMLLMAGLMLADKMINQSGLPPQPMTSSADSKAHADEIAGLKASHAEAVTGLKTSHAEAVAGLETRAEEASAKEQAARRELQDLQTEMTAKVAAIAALEGRINEQTEELDELRQNAQDQSVQGEGESEQNPPEQGAQDQGEQPQAAQELTPDMYTLLDSVATRLEGLVERSGAAAKTDQS